MKALEEAFEKKNFSPNPTTLKNKLMILVNCSIENPSFDSQSKDTLTSKNSTFGSTCNLSKTFLKDIVKKLGLYEDMVAEMNFKEKQKLTRVTTAVKSARHTVRTYSFFTENFFSLTLLLCYFFYKIFLLLRCVISFKFS